MLLTGIGSGAMPDREIITLNQIGYSVLPGERVRVELRLSSPPGEPRTFAIYRPARIVLDLPGVAVNVQQKTQIIDIGPARSITAIESGGRTRVVIKLVRLVPFDTRVIDGSIYITLGATGMFGGTASHGIQDEALSARKVNKIESVDFHRVQSGEGQIIVILANSSLVINTHEQGSQFIVDFLGTELQKCLERRLDVGDFATPVLTIDTFVNGSNVRMVIETTGATERLAYQSANHLTIDIKPSTQ